MDFAGAVVIQTLVSCQVADLDPGAELGGDPLLGAGTVAIDRADAAIGIAVEEAQGGLVTQSRKLFWTARTRALQVEETADADRNDRDRKDRSQPADLRTGWRPRPVVDVLPRALADGSGGQVREPGICGAAPGMAARHGGPAGAA